MGTKIRLDKSRSYGTVSGETAHNIRFEQDGWPFDAHGDLIVKALDKGQKARLEAAEKAEEARLEALKNAPPPAPKAKKTEGGESDPGPVKVPVNLEAWLRGETRYMPQEIEAAVKERYSKVVQSNDEAARFLVEDENLVPAEEADPQVYRPIGANHAERSRREEA